ncbi:hypothetical protein [Syntrophorhabdus aromaticivorans]|uniref:hypothetical protein n=1 Tax=Syntrophorhabdus aromaticivorans TaxID=328301 RepID=UPI00041B9C36|nr:hypothetical protein [Syntrophorhabdus aromaticivorans]
MEYFFIMLITLVYYIIGFFVVWRISKRTKKKWVVGLLIFIVAVLPIWDWLLGIIVYYPACLIVPKVAVYETAETDGIYYKGIHDYIYELERQTNDQPLPERIRVGSLYDDFGKGYQYAESRVVEKHDSMDHRKSIPPVYYRCTPLPKDAKKPAFQPTSCIPIDQPTSHFMVKVSEINFGTTTVEVKKIIDRTTSKLMAEYNGVVRSSSHIGFPFFFWFYRPSGSLDYIYCPAEQYINGVPVHFHDFEYTVLKPKI